MRLLLAALLLFTFVSCSSVGPITATSNKVASKTGKSCYSMLFGIPLGANDLSIYKAAKKGGITKIATVDYDNFYALIYNKLCTVVRGQ